MQISRPPGNAKARTWVRASERGQDSRRASRGQLWRLPRAKSISHPPRPGDLRKRERLRPSDEVREHVRANLRFSRARRTLDRAPGPHRAAGAGVG